MDEAERDAARKHHVLEGVASAFGHTLAYKSADLMVLALSEIPYEELKSISIRFMQTRLTMPLVIDYLTDYRNRFQRSAYSNN